VLPLIAWTTVRLVMFQKNDGRRHNSEMEPQGRGSLPPLYTRRQNRALSLSKTTHEARVHVQTVGLNAKTKKDRHRAEGETFLLTFLLIGLRRSPRSQEFEIIFPPLSGID
jgi:hypothetical protein